MTHPVLKLFKPALECRSAAEAEAYLRRHPVLMSPYYTDRLTAWLHDVTSPEVAAAMLAMRLRLVGTLQALDVFRDPFERYLQGRITEASAIAQVTRPDVVVELMFPAVHGTCGVAEELMLVDWRPAVVLMRMVLAALDARRSLIPENQAALERTAIETWLIVAKTALHEMPDGRIYHDALRRAVPIADLPDETTTPRGQILHRLGLLHLDPYVAGRSSANLDQELRAWATRLHEVHGADLAGIPAKELAMPAVEDALGQAVEFLRRAALQRDGEPRGRTLKAMAQAMGWLARRNVAIDPVRLVEVATEAMTLLPPTAFPAEAAELRQIIETAKGRSHPQSLGAATLTRAKALLERPLEAWVNELGLMRAGNDFRQHAQALQLTRPDLALRLMLRIRPLVEADNEAAQTVHHRELIAYVRRALAPDAPSARGAPLAPVVAALVRDGARRRPARARAAYSLLWLAASSTGTDQEAEGLHALEACGALQDAIDPELLPLLPWVRAVLLTGSAVNAVNAGQPVLASERYAEAACSQIESNQPLAALDSVRRIVDLAQSGPPEVGHALLATLVSNAVALETGAGSAATDVIQGASRLLLTKLVESGRPKVTHLLLTLHVIKGRRFAAALSLGGPVPFLSSPQTLEGLAEIDRVQRLADQERRPPPALLDDETYLTAYVSAKETYGGTTAREQLRNLRIQFDTMLDSGLGQDQAEPFLPTAEAVQQALDPETVLLAQYLGEGPGGQQSLLTILLTREDSFIGIGVWQGWPSSTIVLSDGEERVMAHPLSPHVRDVRSALQEPPPPGRVASPAAVALLNEDSAMLLGGTLADTLSLLRARGKTHLQIWPHGPFHYYPFHLLGAEDRPLAADWCVSALPNISLLSRRPGGGGPRAVTAIGVNFEAGNAQGLAALMEAEPEADAIAALYAVPALTGRAATKARVLDAIATSRRAHIASHGCHDFNAPSFQRIFVWPEDGEPGAIHAFELLKLDLRGLELVTLSACETALGRMDIADNLRGLPAALLIAGVRTIVGTLWPVETNTSARFFTLFHQALHAGARTRDAFHTAQLQTRRTFPCYWDWGAFQIIGA